MALLKDDETKRKSAKGYLNSVLSMLDDIESSDALEFSKWCFDKSELLKKNYRREKFQRLPNNMVQGDIVLVRFGINIGSEMSDTKENSKGHFAMIWCQQGQNFIVIPLTKTVQPKDNKLGVNLGIIKGLPIVTDSYAKLDGVRSVHLRRIYRIEGVKDGKIVYQNIDKIKEINEIVKNHFLLSVSDEVLTK
jgi:mRNA-degrading endonuclease toxin of MazEF toxin-antitoxin module